MPKLPLEQDTCSIFGFDCREILDNAPVGIFITTPGGRYVMANQTLADMYGYDSPRALMESVTDIAGQIYVAPRDRDAFKHLVEQQDRITNFESTRMRRDGTVFWVSLNARAERDARGKVNRYLGFSTDITERKKLEQTLLQANQSLKQSSRMARVGGWELNLATGVLHYSPITREIHEVEPDYVPNLENALNFYKEGENRQKIIEVVSRCMESGDSYDVELQIVTAKGNDRWIRTMGEADFQNGRCVRIFGTIQDITGCKTAREQLQASEARNKALLNALPDMIFLFNRQGVFLDFHASHGSLLFDPADFLGRNAHEVLPAETADLVVFQINRIAAHGECDALGYEAEVNGEIRYFESRMVTCGADFLAIVRDLTDLTRSQETLRDISRQLGKITDNTTDLVALTDLEGNFKYLSKSHQLLGYDITSMIGENILDFVHPEDKPKIISSFEDFLAGRDGARKGELRYLCADGSHLWLETVGSFIHDDLGDLKEILFTSRDVTERKKYEKALLQRNAEFKAAERLARMGAWKYDSDSDVFTGSETAAEILGLRSGGSIPFDEVLSFIHEEDRSLMADIRGCAPPSTLSFDFDLRLDILGSKKWIRVVGARNDNSGDNAVLGMIMDITEKKVSEIQRDEQREQLIQASKMASLGTLVAGVAHEISNPNNLIVLNAPILERVWNESLPILEKHAHHKKDFELAGTPFSQMRDHVLELFSGIHEGSRRITRIVTELKDFARQSSLNMTEFVDINNVAESALALIRKTIHAHTDNFRIFLEPDLPLTLGDSQKLEQVMVNLLINACQALTDKTQAVALETFSVEEDKAVGFKVIDQGEGISPDMLDRILDPFYSTRHGVGGTGLGLSISSSIIQNHKGAMRFQSHPGQGTTVTVIIPSASPETFST
ncbi:hypothetical protein SAMN05660653_01196 [Desulfonatronum thiosulfatophilum]|uniref:histidine kinase n=1 Tax=Desulfonatronum thiosulfatophilum TaxID=617002 RepID=A0A1G6BXR3_9BACT|nr:PAS domain S-box protein [Desulfonatronum thiosulfatophilum]SDB25388.1 hypothetical protein SAMN05660653_01196 [Desulfonatronum thiosulfatophilum]